MSNGNILSYSTSIKPRRLVLSHDLNVVKGKSYTHICALIFLLLFGAVPSSAIEIEDFQIDVNYDVNSCELIAKKVQQKYGGNLVYIAPKTKSGAWILGEYTGHIINRIYVKNEGYIYMDFYSGDISHSTDEVRTIFLLTNTQYFDAEVFVLGERRPPFPLIWHY